ncbi:MAG: zf-HC2 domain-containing protein [Lachnospiraceae bacterium]|nr:zf-HC2 domain-containing protein [Lachnospiraceae bacterium]
MSDCEIVKDLIPLCVDDVASKSSVAFVNEHISTCADCRKVMQDMKSPLQIPISTSEQLSNTKPFEKMRRVLTRKIIQTAVIAVLVICGVLALFYLSDTRNLLNGKPLLTEGDAALTASLKAKAYITFNIDKFPDADYDAIEPAVTAELVEKDEEFFTMVYKVHVEFDVPDVTDDPEFEVLIDALSGDTLKTSVLNK